MPTRDGFPAQLRLNTSDGQTEVVEHARLVLYYRPIFRITPLKSAETKAVFSSSWILFQEDGALLPAQILGGQCRRDRAPMSYDFVYPTFRPRAQARNGVGRELRRSHLAAMPDL